MRRTVAFSSHPHLVIGDEEDNVWLARGGLCKGHGSQRRSRSFYYSHFLRGRPDLVWYRPIPPLSASLHVVAVRAWLLHMGGGGRAVFVSRDHLVGGGGCMSQVRRGRPLETRH